MFAHPLGLLALLALPAIVALHYFRRRFQPRQVSALFLWERVDGVPVSGRERQPLRRSVSLWCELAAAACLALAFAGPRPGSARAEHLVFVLDSSASMGAIVEGRSLRERALEELESRVAAGGSKVRVSMIESGARPRLLAGPAAFPGEAIARLRGFEPRGAHHELANSVALALELSAGRRVVVITDRYRPEEFPPAVELLALGRPAENLAFVHVARTRERSSRPGGGPVERVFLTVANWGAKEATTTLTISAGGRVLQEKPLTLAARGKTSVAFELESGSPLVEARLGDDALAIDNLARLAPVPPRTLALHCALEPPLRARLGLSEPGADEGDLGRWLRIIPDVRIAASAEEAHFALADAPVGSGATACLVIEDSAEDVKDTIGPFLIERRHPVLEGVTFDGVVWSAPAAPVLAGAPLVSAGAEALLTEDRVGGRTLWRLKLDASRATLARAADWPILLSNLAEARRAELPGFARTSVRIGESVVYRAGAELSSATDAKASYVLTSPSGRTREIAPRAELWIDDVDEPGVYELSLSGRKLGGFAASFVDGRESDLADLGSGRRPAESADDAPRLEHSWLELALAAAALAFLLGDFAALAHAARRLTRAEPTSRGA